MRRQCCLTGTWTQPATLYYFYTRPDPIQFENYQVAGNPKYPEISESEKDTRKYPIVYFNTPTRPEPNTLSGIFSNTDMTRPNSEKPYSLGTEDKKEPD